MQVSELYFWENWDLKSSYRRAETGLLTSWHFWHLQSWCLMCEVEAPTADLQNQVTWVLTRDQWTGQQQAIRVPGAKLQAHRKALQEWCRSWQRQKAAAGAPKCGGHQLWFRTGKGHVALWEKGERQSNGLHASREWPNGNAACIQMTQLHIYCIWLHLLRLHCWGQNHAITR